MIARTLRAAAAWLRNRRASPVAPVDLARAEREARQVKLLSHAQRHRDDARRLFRAAQAVEDFGERYSLYCQALAAECRGEAYHALAGGDAESAAQHTMEAAGYDLRAGAPMPVPTQPVEAAHA